MANYRYCFTQRPKISIFSPQVWLVAPIHLQFGMAEGTVGLLGHAEFRANQFTGVGMRTWKFLLLVKSRPAALGEPFYWFLQLEGYVRPFTLR